MQPPVTCKYRFHGDFWPVRTSWLCIALLSRLASSPLAAAEPRDWPVELAIGRFQIHSDFELAAATPLSHELASVSQDVRDLLGIGSEERPVHVVLFQSAHEYHRYMQNYFPQLPKRRALYIQDRGPGMLFTHWHGEVASDLRHEITHAILNDSSQALPLWLDEGLAEYFEVEGSQRFGDSAYLPDVCQRSAQGVVPSLKQLEEVTELTHFREPHYRDSWSWVHYLLHRNAATRALLTRYIAAVRQGTETLPLSRQLPQLTADINADFAQHFSALAVLKPNSLASVAPNSVASPVESPR